MVDQVSRNFSRFREGITKIGEQKSYRVLIDAQTGEMKFPQKIREISAFKGTKTTAIWQEVHLVKHHNHFALEGAEIHLLTARKVVEKTLGKLNADQMRKEIERLPGWKGRLTAIQAEAKLKGQSVGTYLIRSHDDVSNMIEGMKQKYDCEILSYFLVAVAGDKKFSETLILCTPWGWLCYRDEPDLKLYKTYSNPKKILESLEPFAKFPYCMKGM